MKKALRLLTTFVFAMLIMVGCQQQPPPPSEPVTTTPDVKPKQEVVVPQIQAPSGPPEVRGPTAPPPSSNTPQAVTEKENIKLTLPVKQG